ncbi:MAG: YraN family protein [Bacteroidales bacterium]|jgi:putative endonuclease|nr:YraN family protein [Bacteroidales bacterium]
MADHNILGEKGEELARKFLIDNSYEILHSNWRYRKNEIDLITIKNNLLVVVEVKTRSNDYFENPKEAVTRKKQKFIINASEAYINEFDLNLEVRFDVIAVTIINDITKIEHVKDAFQPSLL